MMKSPMMIHQLHLHLLHLVNQNQILLLKDRTNLDNGMSSMLWLPSLMIWMVDLVHLESLLVLLQDNHQRILTLHLLLLLTQKTSERARG